MTGAPNWREIDGCCQVVIRFSGKTLLTRIQSNSYRFLLFSGLLTWFTFLFSSFFHLKEMPQEEANLVMNHRRLWSAHLNPLSTELQGILKDLAGRNLGEM